MVQERNIPLQVIAHCDAGGTLRPLRFRYEDTQHRIHTVRVSQITDSRRLDFVGIEMLAYLCKTEEAGKQMYRMSTRWKM